MHSLIIVGAGPVGLFLALQTARMGHTVLLADQKTKRAPGSNAIGVMPPSLDFFAELGLKNDLVSQGARIQKASVYGQAGSLLGTVGFDAIDSPSPFILAVPQPVTEEVLERALEAEKGVERLSARFVGLETSDDGVTVHFEDAQGKRRSHRGAFCAACDGASSSVRHFLTAQPGNRTAPRSRPYKATFLMGDFTDRTGWGDEARLFFTSFGAVESFPLGSGKRRWIVQTPRFLPLESLPPGLTYLEEQVERRTGVSLDPRDRTWISPFGMRRFLARRWDYDRVFLAGDSAHTMSPIGGQGMNSGFADARHLAVLVDRVLGQGSPHDKLLHHEGRTYTRLRRRACRTAIRRAEMSMALGTVTGFFSPLRNLFLRFLLGTFSKKILPAHYAMLTIPRTKEYS